MPIEDLLHVLASDIELVAVSDAALQKHPDGDRQFLDSFVVQGRQTVILVGFVAYFELLHDVLEGGFATTWLHNQEN